MVCGPGSDGRGAVSGLKADVGGCSRPALAVLSCGSGGEGDSRPDTLSLPQWKDEGAEWTDDPEYSRCISYENREVTELAARQQRRPCYTCSSSCKSRTPVAFMCLLLVRYCNTAGLLQRNPFSRMQFESGKIDALMKNLGT